MHYAWEISSDYLTQASYPEVSWLNSLTVQYWITPIWTIEHLRLTIITAVLANFESKSCQHECKKESERQETHITVEWHEMVPSSRAFATGICFTSVVEDGKMHSPPVPVFGFV
jgi:uncharacterized oligopeptide transporter (OPT) family protein